MDAGIAEAIGRGELSREDREHVAEEIADLGKRDTREAESRVTVLLVHLLEWAAQPERRAEASWGGSTSSDCGQSLCFGTRRACIA